jgi:hypothetical protein
MTFVTPLLLAGTALIALPIILHLIMRRKPKLFEFPALRFVQKRHDTNQRRLRLRHLLLLLLRALAIAALAFALARPSLQFASTLGSQEAPVAAALVFDAAPRMDYRQRNETRLQVARGLGNWLLAQLPPESQIAVLDTRLGPAAFQADRGSAKQRIHQLEAVPNSQPLTAIIEEAARLLKESELDRKEIYVFTDLARGAWPAEAAARLQERLGDLGAVGIYIIDVGVERPSNFSLADVRLSAQVLSSRSTLVVSSELHSTGLESDQAENRAVELHLLDANREPQAQSVESVDIAPGQSRQVEFRVGGLGEGTHQGFLRIVGQDGLAADDQRYFTVQVKPPWRVLLAAPSPAADYTYFLHAALAPETFRRRGQARFECDVIDLRQLAEADLNGYAAVFLLDPTPLSPTTWKKLADFASEGRGIGIFLGRNAAQVDAFQNPQAQELLPGRLLRQARRPDGDAFLAPRDYEHPALAAFRSVAGSIPWEAFPVFRYWQFDDPPPGVAVIARLNDQSPLLFERPLGAGRVLTLATPISDRADARAWNLLPVGVIDNAAPFVMLANQLAGYLVGATDDQLNYQCGQTAVLQLDPRNARRNFVLMAPGPLSLPISADPKQQRLVVTATEQPGNYRVAAGGTADGVDLGFSVNLAPQQTELERLSSDELRNVLGTFSYRLARTQEDIERDVSSARVGRELFTPLILLLGLILAAEQIVANRFYKE